MKKNLIIAACLGISMSMQAQGNPKIDSLISELRAIGQEPNITYSYLYGRHKREIHIAAVHFHDFQPHTKTGDERMDRINAIGDSLFLNTKQRDEEVLRLIQRTCKSMAEDATESYMWEYHRNDIDSIRYSMALGEIPEGKASHSSSTKNHDVYYYDAPQILTYRYTSAPRTDSISRWDMKGMGVFEYIESTDSVDGKTEYLDHEAYTRHIASILKQKGVESRPIFFSHDTTCTVEKSNDNFVVRVETTLPVQPRSETRGTLYTIHSEELANRVLSQLADATWQYLKEHPNTCYEFNPERKYSHGSLRSFFVSTREPQVCDEFRMLIHSLRDEEFHILMLHTQGDLWIPSEWPVLQSWKNGKVTYARKAKRLTPQEIKAYTTSWWTSQKAYTVDENYMTTEPQE